MKYKTGTFFSVLVVFALAAVACSLSLPAQTASNPPSAIPAAQTLTVAPTITATLPPSKTPTSTATPYPTITPIPTETPIPTVTPLGAGPTRTPMYGCQLIDKYPDNWMQIKPHSPFEARFTLKNTGTKIWYPDEISLQYISGVKMYFLDPYKKLNTEIKPDSLVLLIVDMVSPRKSDDHVSVWALVESRTKTALCTFTVKITVK